MVSMNNLDRDEEFKEVERDLDQAPIIYRWSYLLMGAVIFGLFLHEGRWIKGLIVAVSFSIFADSLGRLVAVSFWGIIKMIEKATEVTIKTGLKD